MSEKNWISLREFARRRDVRLSAVQKAIESGRVTAVKRDERGRLTAIDADAATAQWNANTDPVEAARSGKVLGLPLALEAARSGEAPGQPAAMEAASELVGDEPQGRATGHPWAASGAAASGPGPGTDLPLFQAEQLAGTGPAADSSESPAPETGSGLRGDSETAPAGNDKDPHGYYEARAQTEKFRAKDAELEYLTKLGVLVSAAAVERENAEIFSQLKTSVFRSVTERAQQLASETDPARLERVLNQTLRKVFDEFSRRIASDAAAGVDECEESLPA